ESVALVNLRKMSRNVVDAPGERVPARRNGSLHNVDIALAKHVIKVTVLRFDEILGFQTLVLQKSGRHTGEKRTVERGVAVDHNSYLFDGHRVIVATGESFLN